MGSYETREIISQDSFIQVTEQLLGEAERGQLRLEDTRENAAEVLGRLAAIEDETLVVDPSLNLAQFTEYSRRAKVAHSIAQAGLADLEQARAGREQPQQKQPRGRRRILGHGSSPKS
jgi:hypothetical protein